jgi:hypothetical protein
MYKHVWLSLSVFVFLLVGTTIAVVIGRGYRLDFTQGTPRIAGTGLLVATSTPDGASVYLNDHLTTATNNTINLTPGTYAVRITKDGYFPWEKTYVIENEVVSKADATLFPAAPQLESITTAGALAPVIDPSGTRIALSVTTLTPQRNGIYILPLTNAPLLTFSSSTIQIADDTVIPFSASTFSWTPDGRSLIATVAAEKASTYQLDATRLNTQPQDITQTLSILQAGWKIQQQEQDTARTATLAEPIRTTVLPFMKDILWNTDATRIFYTASRSGTLNAVITPPLKGTNPTAQARTVTQGSRYVYDIKEDRNYPITMDGITSWLDSSHLLITTDSSIDIASFDGTNRNTIYGGPFTPGTVFAHPSGNRIVILTNLGNASAPMNLYTINLR